MLSADQILELCQAARILTEPDDINAEYVRGQVNLITDYAGLPGESEQYYDILTAYITQEISTTEFMYQLGGAVVRAEEGALP